MPAAGSLPRYRVMEWQNYVTSELHKGYSPLFRPDFDERARTGSRRHCARSTNGSQVAHGRTFLTGADFTAADAYLYTVTRWAGHVGVDLKDLRICRVSCIA